MAIWRATSALVSSSNCTSIGVVTVPCRSSKADRNAELASRCSRTKSGSPVTAKPRAALSALRSIGRRSEILFSTSSAWSTDAVSARDFRSRPIEAAPITSRIARPIPRMIRCEGIDACISLFRVARRRYLFGEAFIDRGQQRVRCKRLAKAARRAELDGHPQEIRGAFGVGEGVAGHRYDRDLRHAVVEHLDRFEAAHMRHEDVDQHHVEAGAFERPHSGFATVGNGDVETLTLETNLDGNANHRVVIDHENARHDDSFSSGCSPSTSKVPARIKAERSQAVCMIGCI